MPFVRSLAQARVGGLSEGSLSPERESFSLSENWAGRVSVWFLLCLIIGHMIDWITLFEI